MTEQEQPKNDFMHKLALQIVERRNLVFLIVILGAVFTIFSRSWVKVESDLTTYLPKTSETRMGLDIMEKEFTTYGSADVMVANITPDEADQLNDELKDIVFPLLGLEDGSYESFAASVSSMMVRSYAVAIVKPAEGKTDAVKAALEAYVQSEQQSMEHYLEDQYLVAKAATVTVAPTGEVVLVCAEDHDTILSNIEKALAA